MLMILHPAGFRSRFVEIARSQLAVREVGTNGGVDVRRFQSATWLKPGPWPWCGAFVCWCYLETCRQLHSSHLISTRPTTPAAFGFENWGRLHGGLSHDVGSILAGSIVMFNWSHVGIATSDCSPSGIQTVEGNTSSQKTTKPGEGVFAKNHPVSAIRSHVKIHEFTA